MMSRVLSRVLFALWIMGAPLVMIGCSEGEKPAAPPEAPKTEAPAPAPAPAESTPAPAPAPTEAPK